MRIFLTGGTGFIGSEVARLLRERGDEVIALVRSPARATALVGLGCELIEGDLINRIDIDRGVEGADGVIHLAARFEIGIPKHECPKMEDVNVGGVRRVLDSAIQFNSRKILYCSTVNVFGPTNNQTVDETYKRDTAKGFRSCYDSSKYKAHMLAESRAKAGAPVTMVQPGVVYGPGDHFEIGRQILLAAQGRLPLLMMADVGMTMAYVDDVADGIVKAFDNGKAGESYILGGENTTLRELLAKSARLGGKRPPKREVPTALLRLIAPVGSSIAKKMGYPPNLKELIAVSDGATYYATDQKARTELGYAPRSLEEGLRETLMSAGLLDS